MPLGQPDDVQIQEEERAKKAVVGEWRASVIDDPIQSAFVRGKGSGGGKKSRPPQYPLRHSGHGEN
jgi:endonuclease YncB( thermonuclease family)